MNNKINKTIGDAIGDINVAVHVETKTWVGLGVTCIIIAIAITLCVTTAKIISK